MSVRELPQSKLCGLKAEAEQERTRLKENIAQIERECAERRKQADVATKRCRQLQAQLYLLAQAEFIRHCIPKDIAELRHEVRCLTAKVTDEQITVAEQKRLVAELAQKCNELRTTCLHPLVIFTSGYRGSSSDDYDDAFHGTKSCVVCGCTANDTDYDGQNGVFPDNGHRLFNPLIDEFASYSEYREAKLRDRLAAYDALNSTDEIIDQFFGPKRLARLKQLLKI